MEYKFRKLIHIVIGIGLFFIITHSPIKLPIHQVYVLALAISSFYFWLSEAIPLYVTSLYILFIEVVVITPYLKEAQLIQNADLFLAPFSSNIIFLFLGGLLLAKAVSKYGLDKLIANRVVSMSNGHPQLSLLSIMATTALLSMWMSNTATTAMMLIIANALVINLPSESPFKKAFILGIPFAANLGGMGTPIGTPSNAIAIKEINLAIPQGLSFLDWMLAVIPFVVILVVILWYLLIKLYKAPDVRLHSIDNCVKKLSLEHYSIIAVFLLTTFLWLTTGYHHIPSGMIALIPAIIFLSSGLLSQMDFRSISFDVLYLVAGGIALSVALKTSGLTSAMLLNIPLNSFSSIGILIAFMAIGAVMTTFVSNTATANIIIPMIFIIPNISPLPIAIATTLAISSSMILPVSTPPNAIAYSSGNINIVDMIKVGTLITIISALLIYFLGNAYWKLIGIY